MPPESDDDGLFLNRKDRRSRRLRPRRQIGNGSPRLPSGDGFRVDAIALGQRPQALLTMLYRPADRLCRCGAPMKNLSHSASFESPEKTAPSKCATRRCPLDGRVARMLKSIVCDPSYAYYSEPELGSVFRIPFQQRKPQIDEGR